jgi:hypothetical protein
MTAATHLGVSAMGAQSNPWPGDHGLLPLTDFDCAPSRLGMGLEPTKARTTHNHAFEKHLSSNFDYRNTDA